MSPAAGSFRLDGQVAVVIGGTGVLGSRIAGVLSGAGAKTIVVGRDADRGAATVRRLRADRSDAQIGNNSNAGNAGDAGDDGAEPAFVQCDVADRAELAGLVTRILAAHGRVDVLVNGAGVNSATPFLDISDDELQRIVTVNQLAVARACQEFGRYFVERAEAEGIGASIVNIGSASGLVPLSRVFTYSMTKAAVHNLTKNLAREWGPLGIRCNVLVPGFFPADQNRAVLTPDRIGSILAHTPMGRFGEPDDLDGAMLLLASDAGRFITGAELVVDGGFNAMTI